MDGVLGADTITRASARREPRIHEMLYDWLLRVICDRRGHRWQPFGRPLPFGKREFCDRCHSNRLTLDADGSVHTATAMEIVSADPAFGEVLYEARWGDPPRRKLRPGEWPAV